MKRKMNRTLVCTTILSIVSCLPAQGIASGADLTSSVEHLPFENVSVSREPDFSTSSPVTRGFDLGSLLNPGGILQEMGSSVFSGGNTSAGNSGSGSESGLDLGSLLEEVGGLDTVLELFGLGDSTGTVGKKKKSGSTANSKKKSGSTANSSKKKSGSTANSSKKKSGSAKSSTSKKFTVTLSKTSYIYNGEARKPSVTVKVKGVSVPKAAYTVTYKNNKSVGRATVAIKGKGEYSGYTAEKTFKITLKKTTLSTVSSPAAGTIKAGWKKDSQADGYQLQFCTDKEFSTGVKRTKIESGSKITYSQEGLDTGKYYVRIRSFKKVGASNWYSDWSGAKQVSVKG